MTRRGVPPTSICKWERRWSGVAGPAYSAGWEITRSVPFGRTSPTSSFTTPAAACRTSSSPTVWDLERTGWAALLDRLAVLRGPLQRRHQPHRSISVQPRQWEVLCGVGHRRGWLEWCGRTALRDWSGARGAVIEAGITDQDVKPLMLLDAPPATACGARKGISICEARRLRC